MTNATTPKLNAADYAGKTEWDAGGSQNMPREPKTFTVVSRFGITAVCDDREIGRLRDGSLGWASSCNDVWHFDNRADAEAVAQAFGPHRAGATIYVSTW